MTEPTPADDTAAEPITDEPVESNSDDEFLESLAATEAANYRRAQADYVPIVEEAAE